MAIRNLHVGPRLGFAFAVFSLLSFAGIALGVAQNASLRADIDDLASNKIQKIQLEAGAQVALSQSARLMDLAALETNAAELAKATASIMASEGRLSEAAAELEALPFKPTGAKYLKDVGDARARYLPLAREFEKSLESQAPIPARMHQLQGLVPARDQYEAALATFAHFENADATIVSAAAVKSAEQGIDHLWTFGVAAALLSALASVVITRSITRPLRAALKAANSVAAGDLHFACDGDHSDEPGQLLSAIQDIQQVLERLDAAYRKMSEDHSSGVLGARVETSGLVGTYLALATRVNDISISQSAETQAVIAAASAYAKGEFSVAMTSLPGQRANLTLAMNEVRSNLQSLSADVRSLLGAACRGDLSARGDTSGYHNEYRQIVEAVNELLQATQSIFVDAGRALAALAEGDLTVRVESDHLGEFAAIATHANRSSEQLALIVAQNRATAESIQLGADAIAHGNRDLTAKTEKQAESLKKTADCMNELTLTVARNEDNARQAFGLSCAAGDTAIACGQLVSNVEETMSKIASSSRSIGEITSVIDGIAVQTNILALNAAVEAARAGPVGRGFAVVAVEIRALSHQSAAAAKQIKALIALAETNVSHGESLVASAARSMSDIVTSVVRVSDIMGELTSAAAEQSARIDDVNQSVVQMVDVTRENAELVQGAVVTAASLAEQALELNQAMQQFRLADDELVQDRIYGLARPDLGEEDSGTPYAYAAA